MTRISTLVVTDLDGTLWDRDLRAADATLRAAHELIAADDVELLVATGRRRNSARTTLTANGLSLPAVLLNGALGYDFVADTLFHQICFEPHVLGEMVDLLADHDVVPLAYLADTRAAALEGVTTSIGHLESLGDDLVWMNRDELTRQADALGLAVLGVADSLVAPVDAVLADDDRVECAAYADHLHSPWSMMIGPAGVNKAEGIKAWCAYADVQPDRIVAIGDAGNDLEMLEAADLAIVVASGDPRALQLADEVIRPPSEGGWADVLDLI